MRIIKNRYFLILLLNILVVFFLVSVIFSIKPKDSIRSENNIKPENSTKWEDNINLNETNNFYKKEINNEFAIIPHFMIKPEIVDEFYAKLHEKYYPKIDKIVLISPNHFWLWTKIFSSIDEKKEVCYKNDCIKLNSLVDNNLIFSWKWNENIFNSDDLFKKDLDKIITNEHWIWEHFRYLNKYFPKKEVYPLVISPWKFANIESVKDYLEKKFQNESVLFIASVDFSHYVDEKYAYIHDKKTFYTLNNSVDLKDYKNIEVDCPNCLYLINSLAYKNNKFPIKYHRDSSSTITWKDQKFNNTSRQFIYYDTEKKEDNWITIAYYWDLMYDRGVSKFLKSKQDFYNHFSSYFSRKNINNSLKDYHHRKLFWIDFVWFNLETPVVEKKSFCEESAKKIKFCSLNTFLPWIKDLWFNLVNIANNHSMDWWITAHKNTIKNLDEVWLNYAWYIRHWRYFENNYVYTQSIRWIKCAWHGYDFTITKTMIDTYCDILKKYKTNGYNNFVSVHWWVEYQNKHNITQENYAKKLIDCWADLIIGHHPHVPSDIWEYKWKKIIYSLWNFLFDQWFSNDTKNWMEVLIDYNLDWNTKIFTWSIDAYMR